jgi:hypothetical protein
MIGDIATLYDPEASICPVPRSVDPEYSEIVSPDHPDPVIFEILDPECHPAVGVEILGVVVAKSAIAKNVPSNNTVATEREDRDTKLYIQIKIKK